MKQPQEYAVQIVWSSEDQAYLAWPFELPGCVADGQTPEEAMGNLKVIIGEWLEVARAEGRKVPTPMSLENLRKREAHQMDELRQQIEKAVRDSIIPELLRQLAATNAQRGINRFSAISWDEQSEPAGFRRG